MMYAYLVILVKLTSFADLLCHVPFILSMVFGAYLLGSESKALVVWSIFLPLLHLTVWLTLLVTWTALWVVDHLRRTRVCFLLTAVSLGLLQMLPLLSFIETNTIPWPWYNFCCMTMHQVLLLLLQISFKLGSGVLIEENCIYMMCGQHAYLLSRESWRR